MHSVRVPVAMTPQITAILERARNLGSVKGINVIHALDGQPYSYHGAHSAWERACKRARETYEAECKQDGQKADEDFLIDAHFHDLKHKALTDAKRQGLDAQKLGGHTTAKMTARYLEDVELDWIRPPTIGGIS